MNLSTPKRIKLYKWLRKHGLITNKGIVFLDLCLNRAAWENHLATMADQVGFSRGHLREFLREMEREGIAKSRREPETRRLVYELNDSKLALPLA